MSKPKLLPGKYVWFELVCNREPGTFDTQPAGLRSMWLDNYGAERPAAPSPEPLTCEQLGAISVPTLAIGAEYGISYSRWIVESLVRCIPDSRAATAGQVPVGWVASIQWLIELPL